MKDIEASSAYFKNSRSLAALAFQAASFPIALYKLLTTFAKSFWSAAAIAFK